MTKNCSSLPVMGMGARLHMEIYALIFGRKDKDREFLLHLLFLSCLYLKSPYVKGAYFGVAYSDLF